MSFSNCLHLLLIFVGLSQSQFSLIFFLFLRHPETFLFFLIHYKAQIYPAKAESQHSAEWIAAGQADQHRAKEQAAHLELQLRDAISKGGDESMQVANSNFQKRMLEESLEMSENQERATKDQNAELSGTLNKFSAQLTQQNKEVWEPTISSLTC